MKAAHNFRVGLVAALLALLVPYIASSQETSRIANPTVVGPIATPASQGDSSHGYVFFASDVDLRKEGYIEEEFFLEGLAKRYGTPALETATVRDTGHAYRTRIVVRRPVEVQRFNGTVLLEWLNVTAGFDIDIDWLQAHEHLLRAGYAWVGVSAQRVGIHGATGLKSWSPARYGTLDVTKGGTILDDALSYDIFSQAAQAVRNPSTVRVLGPLVARLVIATGHSQSANRLVTYYNSIQPLTAAFDGFLIHGGGSRLRTDLTVKAWKLVAETDLNVMQQAANRQPDTDVIRTWEVAGASHADSYFGTLVEQLQQRDFGRAISITCDRPTMSRIPFRYVMHSAYDRLVVWIREDTAPPTAPRITLASEDPAAVIARDPFGNASGGVRLPEHAVPTATNTGDNSGGQFCNLFGSHQPFEPARLVMLYPTHSAYVNAVTAAADDNVRAGYLLRVDAERTIREAEQSSIGGP